MNNVMKEAHRIAREYLTGDYKARLSEALKIAWADQKRGYSLELYKEPQNNADYRLFLFGKVKGYWSTLAQCNAQTQSRIDEVKEERYLETNGNSSKKVVSDAIAELKAFQSKLNSDVSIQEAKL